MAKEVNRHLNYKYEDEQKHETTAEEEEDWHGARHSDDDDEEDGFDECEEDVRIEGTTAYLPPEVVAGGVPTTAADTWALGCVLYQCLSGRPPMLEDTEDDTRRKIVTFNNAPDSSSSADFFDPKVDFPAEAKQLILESLSPAPQNRPSMMTVSAHPYFAGVDVFTLHKTEAPQLNTGCVQPNPNAKWARRQFSSIWAPQPKAYGDNNTAADVVGDAKNHTAGVHKVNGVLEKKSLHELRKTPIVEGEERNTLFLSKSRIRSNKKNAVPNSVNFKSFRSSDGGGSSNNYERTSSFLSECVVEEP